MFRGDADNLTANKFADVKQLGKARHILHIRHCEAQAEISLSTFQVTDCTCSHNQSQTESEK